MSRAIDRVAALVYRGSAVVYGAAWRTMTVAAALRPRVECLRCVQHTGIPGVTVASDGLCSDCRRHASRADPQAIAASTALFFDRLPSSAHNVLVSVSGGKDSLAALVLTASRPGARPLALMLDHGFIPPDVKRQAEDLCARLGVPLRVVTADLDRAFAAAWRRPGLNPFPCFPCCEALARAIVETCDRERIDRVVTGLRWLWEDWHLPVTDASFAYRHFRVRVRSRIHVLNILAGLGIGEDAQLDLLRENGCAARPVGGDSTCCTVFGLFERAHLDRFGFYWEGERFLSKEIRAGAITRNQARRKLARPEIPPEVEREVLDKIGR